LHLESAWSTNLCPFYQEFVHQTKFWVLGDDFPVSEAIAKCTGQDLGVHPHYIVGRSRRGCCVVSTCLSRWELIISEHMSEGSRGRRCPYSMGFSTSVTSDSRASGSGKGTTTGGGCSDVVGEGGAMDSSPGKVLGAMSGRGVSCESVGSY
jgi:hypothetical protein